MLLGYACVVLYCSSPPLLSLVLEIDKLVLELPQLIDAGRLGVENPEMLLFQLLEGLVELFVPRVQDEHLEAQGGGGDDEVGQADAAGENHGG